MLTVICGVKILTPGGTPACRTFLCCGLSGADLQKLLDLYGQLWDASTKQ
jgi:hypothetical protein